MLGFSRLPDRHRENVRLLCVKKGSIRASFPCMTLKSTTSALFMCTDMGKIEPSLWKARVMTEEELLCLEAVAKIIASAFSCVLCLVSAA